MASHGELLWVMKAKLYTGASEVTNEETNYLSRCTYDKTGCVSIDGCIATVNAVKKMCMEYYLRKVIYSTCAHSKNS